MFVCCGKWFALMYIAFCSFAVWLHTDAYTQARTHVHPHTDSVTDKCRQKHVSRNVSITDKHRLTHTVSHSLCHWNNQLCIWGNKSSQLDSCAPSKGFPFSQQEDQGFFKGGGGVATVSIGGSGIDLAQQQHSSTAGQKLPLHYNLLSDTKVSHKYLSLLLPGKMKWLGS